MTKVERTELEELSLKAFGVKSRWKPILNKGKYIATKEEGTTLLKKGHLKASPIVKYRNVKRKIYLTVADVKNIMNLIIQEKNKHENAGNAGSKA